MSTQTIQGDNHHTITKQTDNINNATRRAKSTLLLLERSLVEGAFDGGIGLDALYLAIEEPDKIKASTRNLSGQEGAGAVHRLNILPAPQHTDAPGKNTARYEQAAEALYAVAGKQGREGVIAILKYFGATHLYDVDPPELAKLVATCEASTRGLSDAICVGGGAMTANTTNGINPRKHCIRTAMGERLGQRPDRNR